MLKTTSWKEIAELIGIAAIVGSLVFVGLELRQTQTSLMASTYQARAFDAISTQRVLADSEYIGPLLAKIDIDDKQSLDSLSEEELWRLQRHYMGRMIDIDNEYFQYQSGFLDEKYYEDRLKPSLIRNAKRWRRLGLSETRPELQKLADELLAEDSAE
jgi:hypothetical protein